MKRLMTNTLIEALQQKSDWVTAELFSITLPTGAVMNATDGQWDLTVAEGTGGWSGSTTTFSATQWGRWSRGAITSEASFGLQGNTMDLTLGAIDTVVYPNTTLGILAAGWQGLFDDATLWVWRAWMTPGYGAANIIGIETKFQGRLSDIKQSDRTKIIFEVSDPIMQLDQNTPNRLFQAGCPLGFCDSNCTLDAANYTISFTAKTGSTQTELIPTVAFTTIGAGCVEGYFTRGKVTCTGGNNSGLSLDVLTHASGNLYMDGSWILPVQAGDTFSVIKGCLKTMEACSGTTTTAGVATNNLINFEGTPFTPVPTDAV